MSKISIIIPTFNEAASIERLVTFLLRNGGESIVDIIVSDAGSDDETIIIATQAGARAVISPVAGRAPQMNHGASLATGDILYFVHADCLPPATFASDIQKAVADGFGLGRYQTRFDSSRLILKVNAWFTRFDMFACMGGDQTLFVKRSIFQDENGFREDMRIMEEYEFCDRARQNAQYKIMAGKTLISARKYETNSWWRVQFANATIVRLFKRGATQQHMVDTYQRLLNYRKNAF
jgi:rSAM/selenodomain-associated transferase 2